MLRFKAQLTALKPNSDQGQETAKSFDIAIKEHLKHIQGGLYLIDPAKCGNLSLKNLPADPYATRSVQERLFQTRWKSTIRNDVRWSDDTYSGPDADMPDADEDSEGDTRNDRYIVEVDGEQILLHDYLGKERDQLIHDIHDVGSLTLADPPHASRPRYPWQKTGVDMMHKAREKIEGSLNIDEMGLGKTGQALNLIMTQKRHDNDAFSVVLTEKAVLITGIMRASLRALVGPRGFGACGASSRFSGERDWSWIGKPSS